eukprot:291651_1
MAFSLNIILRLLKVLHVCLPICLRNNTADCIGMVSSNIFKIVYPKYINDNILQLAATHTMFARYHHKKKKVKTHANKNELERCKTHRMEDIANDMNVFNRVNVIVLSST